MFVVIVILVGLFSKSKVLLRFCIFSVNVLVVMVEVVVLLVWIFNEVLRLVIVGVVMSVCLMSVFFVIVVLVSVFV